jgi:16S rRNA processing protein RimM
LSGISQSVWVPIAHLLRPQGRRGEILAEPLSDLPDIFTSGREFVLSPIHDPSPTSGSLPVHTQVHIQEHWYPTGKNAGRVVLKLSGCDSISDAESLAGQHLLIASSQLPALDADTFFVGDLVGCTVCDAGSPIGTIVGVEFPVGPDGRTRLEDAATLLAVQLSPAAHHFDLSTPSAPSNELPEPVLIPFVRAWLDTVDIPGRRISMHLPEGLVESVAAEVKTEE